LKLVEQTLKTWLTKISLSEREMFREVLFEILGASEGDAIKSNLQESLQEIKKILKKYSGLDKESKKILIQVFESLSAEARKILSGTIKEKIITIKESITIRAKILQLSPKSS